MPLCSRSHGWWGCGSCERLCIRPRMTGSSTLVSLQPWDCLQRGIRHLHNWSDLDGHYPLLDSVSFFLPCAFLCWIFFILHSVATSPFSLLFHSSGDNHGFPLTSYSRFWTGSELIKLMGDRGYKTLTLVYPKWKKINKNTISISST